MTAKALIRDEFYCNGVSLFLRVERTDKPAALTRLVFEDIEPGYVAEPITDHSAGFNMREIVQAVLDAAWEANMRPTGFSDIKNETAAIRSHLEDMRTIAMDGLGIKTEKARTAE